MPHAVRYFCLALSLAVLPAVAAPALAEVKPVAAPSAQGVVRLRSTHSVADTVQRLKAAVESKGIRFFDAIDQHALAESVNLKIGPSTLVLFGNPPLGVQFLQSNRYSGLDWPVRMLVTEEADGSVWLAWSDFTWVAHRYGIKDKDTQFKFATGVASALAAAAAE